MQETKEILLRWVNSCENAFQLDLMLKIIHEFFIKRFKTDSDSPLEMEYELAYMELKDSWASKMLTVASQPEPEEIAPTLALNLQNH